MAVNLGNQVIARKTTITTSWQAISSANDVVTVTITAPTTNSGSVSLKGDDGSTEIPLEPGEWHTLKGVDLSSLEVKGTAGDIVTIIGGAW